MSNLHPAVSRLSAPARREFENAIHADRHVANLAEAGARSRTTVQLQERIIIAVGSAHPPLRCAAPGGLAAAAHQKSESRVLLGAKNLRCRSSGCVSGGRHQ